MTKNVVLVHGLWLGGYAMQPMAGRLRKEGFRTRIFNYDTTSTELAQHMADLYRFSILEDDRLPHFVAHSMGGLLTLQMLKHYPEVPSGRVVLMGSPLKGSAAARQMHRWRTGPKMLGKAATPLVEGVSGWPEEREVGMIAGTRALGLGILAGGARRPGDGTVFAEESDHEGLDDRIEIATSHTGLLISRETARQAIFFLRNGFFDQPN